MTLYFHNPGVADVRAMTTIGVNVKNPEHNAIGFFGSGFKYGVAGVLRLGGRIIMWLGNEEHEFISVNEEISGQEFGIVHIVSPGQPPRPLGFTTAIGKTWEPWMFYREFRCNATDEGGDIPNTINPGHASGTTLIEVICEEVEEAHLNRHKYFLSGAPLYSLEECEVHSKSDLTGADFFYRNIRVGAFKRPGLFRYNLTAVTRLTEDRTVAYPYEVERCIVRSISQSVNPEFIYEVLTAEPDYMESSLDFSILYHASEQFLDVAEKIHKQKPKHWNSTVISLLVRNRKYDPYVWLDPTVVEAQQLIIAEKFCLDMGYDTSNTSIRIVENLGSDVLGKVHLSDVYLSKRVFSMGTKMVAGTLLEEMIHITHGHTDESREMQNYLLDKLVTMYEEKSGKPL